MGKANNLQPTHIVDKNGVQTTRNMKAFEKPKQTRQIPVTPSIVIEPLIRNDISQYMKHNPNAVIFMDEMSTSPIVIKGQK